MITLLTPDDVSAYLKISSVHARALMSGMDGVLDIGSGNKHCYRISESLFTAWLQERQKTKRAERKIRYKKPTASEYADAAGHCKRR